MLTAKFSRQSNVISWALKAFLNLFWLPTRTQGSCLDWSSQSYWLIIYKITFVHVFWPWIEKQQMWLLAFQQMPKFATDLLTFVPSTFSTSVWWCFVAFEEPPKCWKSKHWNLSRLQSVASWFHCWTYEQFVGWAWFKPFCNLLK